MRAFGNGVESTPISKVPGAMRSSSIPMELVHFFPNTTARVGLSFRANRSVFPSSPARSVGEGREGTVPSDDALPLRHG